MPARSFVSTSAMSRSLRLKPNARRSSSASVAVKPAVTIAIPKSCSWNSGTPSVRRRIGSRLGCGYDGLAAAPAPDVGMYHIAHDRSGADDRDLHDEIVEPLGTDARERRHLGAALDLEHADRVGLLQAPVHGGIVRRQPGEIHLAPGLTDERQRILEHRHHSQSAQIHLDDAEP